MKKKICNVVILMICFTSFMAFSASNTEIIANLSTNKIIIDGIEKSFKNPIVSIDDRTYVSLRELAEHFNMIVDWNEEDKTVMINQVEKNESVLYPFESNGLWGYRDQAGNEVVPPIYFEANEFCEGLGLVKASSGQDGKYGFVDNSGTLVIECVYYQAYSFSDGAALVSLATHTDEDKWSYIDKQGNRLFDKEFTLAHSFSENYAVVLKEGYGFPVPPSVDIQKRWSYIGKDGNFATEMDFEEAMDFHNGYAFVKNDGKWGVINTDFEFVIPCQYESIEQIDVNQI